jgi:hypothetical protein
MLEMNKTHFEESLKAMQADHTGELARAASTRAAEDGAAQTKHQEEVEALKMEMKALRAELENEKVEKQTALAKLAVRDYHIVPRDGILTAGTYTAALSACGSRGDVAKHGDKASRGA